MPTATTIQAEAAILSVEVEALKRDRERDREEGVALAQAGEGYASRLAAFILQRVADYERQGIAISWRSRRADLARRLATVVATKGDHDAAIRLAAGHDHDPADTRAALAKLLNHPPNAARMALDAAKRTDFDADLLPIGASSLEVESWTRRRSEADFRDDLDGSLHELAVASHAAEWERQQRKVDALQLRVTRAEQPDARLEEVRRQLAGEQARASGLASKVVAESAHTARLEAALLDANAQLRNLGMSESPLAAIKRDVAAVIDQAGEQVPDGVSVVLKIAGDEPASRALFERVSQELRDRGIDRKPDTVRRWLSKYRPTPGDEASA